LTEDKPNILVGPHDSKITLKLKSNPTTGYSWFLRQYDTGLVVPVKREYKSPEKEMIGSGGYELWTFTIKQSIHIVPQQTTIRLVYARPWQGSDNSTQMVFHISSTAK